MKVVVLGGDGFCGWPTSLYLSKQGHDVTIVDNLSRRNIDNEMGASSLTPIVPIGDRISAWQQVTDKIIHFVNLDIAQNYAEFLLLIESLKPDAIVHFAEQRAAPYSMKSPKHKRYTVDNNINATHNVLCAIVESKLPIHLVHLGTTGVYGYGTAGFEIPEGYLKVDVKHDNTTFTQEIVYPYHPGSVYHMTKCMDNVMFHYYAKNDQLAITDLHQGIVWGTATQETKLDERLINRFDYDGDYGTVLNRFLMQAAVGYPLTVYGTGGQTRAFIHIQNTVQCIEIALLNPPKRGDRVQIFNQLTESYTVKELAKKVAKLSGAEIQYIENPRVEAADNELQLSNRCFLDKGLHPITLSDNLLDEIMDIAKKYKDRCDKSIIKCVSYWRTKS